MSSNEAYIEEYAGYAMEQMKRYGIPASVTLAQGICESSSGKSELSRLGNNHFGMKASKSWLESGGGYLVYDDDKPNEKFCKYASVGDSYEHHSRVLANSKHYKACFKLQPDDYVGWTRGLQRGGYATDKSYASTLQSIIKSNNLQKFDQQVMAELKKEGKSIGTDNNPRKETASPKASSQTKEQEQKPQKQEPSKQKTTDEHYSFPVKRDRFMLITSGFGNRRDPMDKSKIQFHKGIDIKTKHEPVLATEDKGKVIETNSNANTKGGRTVTVEYNRNDGSKYQCTYMHLDSIVVKEGDTVNAGQKLGISGNTGTRTTGEHLHFGVKSISADGSKRDMDPAAYLAEVSVKGNINIEAQHNGKDIIAKYKDTVDTSQQQASDKEMSPDDWMKKLLCSEDSGLSDSNGDPLIEYAMTMFTSLMTMAVQIDNKSNEDKNQAITEALVTKSLDLSALLPKLKDPIIKVGDNGKTTFSYSSDGKEHECTLSNAQMTSLNTVINNDKLTTEQKQKALSTIVATIIASQKASDNYQQMNSAQQSQETIQRR